MGRVGEPVPVRARGGIIRLQRGSRSHRKYQREWKTVKVRLNSFRSMTGIVDSVEFVAL